MLDRFIGYEVVILVVAYTNGGGCGVASLVLPIPLLLLSVGAAALTHDKVVVDIR